MSAKDFYYEENTNQGLGAINNLCFPVCLFYFGTPPSFLKQHKLSFLYLCILYLKSLESVTVLTVGWVCPCDVVNLQYSVPKLIVLPPSLHCVRLTLLFIPVPFPVTQCLWCTFNCVLWVVYKYFIPLFFFIASFSLRTLGHVVIFQVSCFLALCQNLNSQ